MALRYIDSMGDHYTADQAPLKWTTCNGMARQPGLHGYSMTGRFQKALVFGSNTLIMEAYVLRGGLSFELFIFADTVDRQQLYLWPLESGAIQLKRWSPGHEILAQSAPDIYRLNTWYHLGWKVFAHPTAGTVEVRWNGETIISYSGVTTGGEGWSGQIGAVILGHGSRFDDLVVMDDVDDGINDPRLPGGGGFDKFLGPVEITVKRPNGAGLAAEWTPSPPPANWQNVDELTTDNDATFNGAMVGATGASDLFAMENLGVDEDVVAVQSLVLARKTEEGIAGVAKLVHDNAVTYVGPTKYQPNTYSYMHAPEPTLPDGTLWTKARWDAIQYGYRRMV